MRILENKLSVASTSALVLSVAKSLYQDGWSREYISRIDFSAVEKLAEELYRITPLFQDVLLIRKRMVRHLVTQLMLQHPRQQVCILGAGLDPLGLKIAEDFPIYPKAIYEIDNAYVQEKKELYASVSFDDERLYHLQGDLTNIPLLMQTLIDTGYDPNEPTLIIFEGIMHYISEEQFLRIMRAFCSRTRNNAVIMDYMLQNEDLPFNFVSVANDMLEVLGSAIGMPLRQFSRKKILNLLSLLEAEIFEVYDMQAAEYILNGHNKKYHLRGEGMLEMIVFSI
jgi:O-methyltransferase involved in polyketide biosynthesis